MRAPVVLLSALSAALLAGCDGRADITTSPPATSLVRFVNATNSNIDVVLTGAVATPNLSFGGSTGCMILNTASPGLAFRLAGGTTDLAGFTPSFAANEKYHVVAVADAAGAITFVTIPSAFGATAPAAGIVGLNAVPGGGPFDLHVTAPSTALGTGTITNANLAFGVPSSFASVTLPVSGTATTAAMQFQFTNAGSTTVARNHGNSTLGVGGKSLAIVGPPATGSTALRSTVNGTC